VLLAVDDRSLSWLLAGLWLDSGVGRYCGCSLTWQVEHIVPAALLAVSDGPRCLC
jgi:hypothetical protein